MRSDVPQGSWIAHISFLLFVNDLPDALEALTLLFADNVKEITHLSQNMNLRQFSYCHMGLVEEMGPTDQFLQSATTSKLGEESA